MSGTDCLQDFFLTSGLVVKKKKTGHKAVDGVYDILSNPLWGFKNIKYILSTFHRTYGTVSSIITLVGSFSSYLLFFVLAIDFNANVVLPFLHPGKFATKEFILYCPILMFV